MHRKKDSLHKSFVSSESRPRTDWAGQRGWEPSSGRWGVGVG